MGLAAIPRKLSTMMRMDPLRRSLMAEAVLWLALARVALLIFPFRHVARRLGTVIPAADPVDHVPPSQDMQLARDVGWAVRRVAGYVPFKAVCLQQAIAAKMMLRRRGVRSTLHFGVAPARPPAKALDAHAWLRAAGIGVTGYPVGNFAEVARFL